MTQYKYKWLPDSFPPKDKVEAESSSGLALSFSGGKITQPKAVGKPVAPSGNSLKIAVVIHAFYPELLDEYIARLKNIQSGFDVFITAPEDKMAAAEAKFSGAFGKERIKSLVSQNRGRDIAPFLIEAGKHLSGYDLVCKLHTKKSTHAQYGKDWAIGIIDSLIGSAQRVSAILDDFRNDPTLGFVCPSLSAVQIWGFNLPGAQLLAGRLGIGINLQMNVFCSGSMFWFRPQALSNILDYHFRYEDFAEEGGQEDGTLAHMIERMTLSCVSNNNFTWTELPPSETTVDICSYWSHMMTHWKGLVEYNKTLGLRAQGALAACRELPGEALTGRNSNLPEVIALPLPEDWKQKTDKPFFSVMIPVYNPQEKYLVETIKSVLKAMPADIPAQIEVVDDCSTTVDVKKIVAMAGEGKVIYTCNKNNLGLLDNWHECVRRSEGEWVHILHQDDVVYPDYYKKMREGLLGNPEAGMGYCRPSHINENSQRIFEYWKERETPGIAENWLINVVRRLPVQFACIVVRRDVYAVLGGYCTQAGHASDWEMWIRIASCYPVFYHPEIMAAFRVHNLSESGRSSSAAKNINDTNSAIDIVSKYLPREYNHWLAHARDYYANSALAQAKNFLQQRDIASANALIDAGLRLRPSAQFIQQFQQLRQADNNTGRITPEVLNNISTSLAAAPDNSDLLDKLRQARAQISQQILNTASDDFIKTGYATYMPFVTALNNSPLRSFPLLEQESANIRQIVSNIKCVDKQNINLNLFVILTLYTHAYKSGLAPADMPLATPLRELVLTFMFRPPEVFTEVGDADRFALHIKDATIMLHDLIVNDPASELAKACSNFFAQNENYISVYFNSLNLREAYMAKAQIITHCLKLNSYPIDWTPKKRKNSQSKIRIGFLNGHFGPQTETYTSLPYFEHLDKKTFEVTLISLTEFNTPLAQYCGSRVDHTVVVQPQQLPMAVDKIRSLDLDVLVFGTNITAVSNHVTLLACHKMARVQLVNNSSPTSSGMPFVDGYINGTLVNDSNDFYSEKLYRLEGPAHCFAYTADNIPVSPPMSREQFGYNDDDILLVSGANFYKIIPELMELWAGVLARQPKAKLILMPFSRAWSPSYPEKIFVKTFTEVIKRCGASPEQLVIRENLPNRNAVIELIKICDLCLDAVPYSGANSVVDPLEAGKPIVCVKGHTFRNDQGPGILRSAGLEELIASDNDDYIAKVLKLVGDKDYYSDVCVRITSIMNDQPFFLDRKAFGEKVAEVYKQSWQDYLAK